MTPTEIKKLIKEANERAEKAARERHGGATIRPPKPERIR